MKGSSGLGSKGNNEAKVINFPILRKCNCDCGFSDKHVQISTFPVSITISKWKIEGFEGIVSW
jgi:hypothetical protein